MPNSNSKSNGTNTSYVPVVINYTPTVQPRIFYERRHLTLCSCSYQSKKGKWSTLPTCKLQGQWMHKAGFRPGQTVEIKVYHKKIILQVIREKEENFPDRRA